MLQREYLQQKFQKKIRYKVLEGILTAKIANIKKIYFILFLSFLYIKGLDIKMDLISVEGYNNAGVHNVKVKNDLWVSMKDVGNGLGVKNISDLVLKEIYGAHEKTKLTKEEIKCFKMTEREIFEKIGKLSNNELDKLCNKPVFVKNTIMTNIINHCRGEKKGV